MISPLQRPVPDNIHSAYKRQMSTPPTGSELTIPAIERTQTHALDRAATGSGNKLVHSISKILSQIILMIEDAALWEVTECSPVAIHVFCRHYQGKFS